MNTIKNHKIAAMSVIALAMFFSFIFLFIFQSQTSLGSGSTYNTDPVFATASSTAFTLTTTSKQLLATTTTPHRLAATIQPINCTAGSPVFMTLNNDLPATANSGIAAFASTTLHLDSYPNTPITQSAVEGITNSGTCTVLVTEWRTLY